MSLRFRIMRPMGQNQIRRTLFDRVRLVAAPVGGGAERTRAKSAIPDYLVLYASVRKKVNSGKRSIVESRKV